MAASCSVRMITDDLQDAGIIVDFNNDQTDQTPHATVSQDSDLATTWTFLEEGVDHRLFLIEWLCLTFISITMMPKRH